MTKNRVAVAGGGIAGLTAGATLASGGVPVVLFERNARVGGSCATFRRGPFRFDAGTSALSGLGPGGRLKRIFDGLGIDPRAILPAVRETIVTPRFTFVLPSGDEAIRNAFAATFQGQRNAVSNLFSLIDGRPEIPPGTSFAGVLSRSGVEGGPRYLVETLLGNLGVPAGRADGATVLAFLREFLLDGGYYPADGIGALTERFADRIRSGGGEIRCGAQVEEFGGTPDRIDAVILSDGSRHPAAAFIAGMSARRTHALAPANLSSARRSGETARMTLSPSAFMVFLGLNCRLDELTPHQGHILSMTEEAASDLYRTLDDDERLFSREGYVYLIAGSRLVPEMAPPGGESLCLFVLAPYRDREFWDLHRARMADALVARAERVAPGLSTRISVMESATPHTLERYTGNDGGAIYGWEATAGQVGPSRLSPATPWGNLFLAGHWTRPGSGISAAAASGHLAARMAKRRITGDGLVPRD